MIFDLFLTALGLVILLLGGEATLRGAIGLARLLGVSPAMIGLTVIAFGTSAPELTVSLNAALAGQPDIAIGNVVGSNIANILMVLGIGALITPLVCNPLAVRRDAMAMLAALVVLVLLGLTGEIFAWHGVLMVAALVAYIGWTYRVDRRTNNPAAELHAREAEETTGVPAATPVVLLYLAVGLGALIGGAALMVEGAVSIARDAGISESVIGLSLVAFGTSLPELTATAVAAWRRHTDVAVANVLGSNLFNVLLILGTASNVAPLPFAADIVRIDIWIMLASGIVLIPIMITGWRVSRAEGAFMLICYVAYIASLALGYGRAVV